MTMIEAMACGTPVLGARMGSIPEIVVDGVTGFLCDSVDDAVAKVPHLASLDRHACRARVEAEFTVERMVDRYLDAYAMALEQRLAVATEPGKTARARTRLVGPPDGLHRHPPKTKEPALLMSGPERDYSHRSLFDKLGVIEDSLVAAPRPARRRIRHRIESDSRKAREHAAERSLRPDLPPSRRTARSRTHRRRIRAPPA